MSAAVHEFHSSIEIERQGRALLDAAYRQLFGSLLEDQHIMGSLTHQKAGVDVLLFLRTGRTLAIDEKVRRHGISSGDVAIEIEHVYEGGQREPGWLLRSTHTDFVAFAWLSDRVVWLLPIQGLLSAYERRWSADSSLRRIESKNVGQAGRKYITRSLIVPSDRVISAVGAALRVHVREEP